MLVTDSDDLAATMRLLRSHGMTTRSYDRAQGHATRYDVVGLGYNYRMDDIRASLVRAQLAKLEGDRAARITRRRAYETALRGIHGITVPFSVDEPSSHYIFPIVLTDGGAERRDAIRGALRERGIETSMHYPPVHRFSLYAPYATSLPHTEFVGDHLITLPMFSTLTDAQIAQVVTALQEALDRYGSTVTASHHLARQ